MDNNAYQQIYDEAYYDSTNDGNQSFLRNSPNNCTVVTKSSANFVMDNESSDLDIVAFQQENINLRTANMSDSYSQNYTIRNSNKHTEIHDTIPTFNNEDYYKSAANRKRQYEESSSSTTSEDSDQQYHKTAEYERHNSSKRKKIKKIKHDEHIINNVTNEYIEGISVNKNVKQSQQIGKAQRMMQNMGYQPGEGLGKHGQGRLEPIEVFMRQGRRGFGHCIPGLKEASLKWDPQKEEIKPMEDIKWLRNMHPCVLTTENMTNWTINGPQKKTIIDETKFCAPEIVQQVVNSKTVFDKLDKVEMRKARTRSNPYETIRNAGFLNRAAVKMANINRACNFMFTDPKPFDSKEILYFADVCAGPGGFSEYILSQKKWHAKGFGFTLKNENDFKLDDFYAGPCETFHPFYGSRNNGDVFDSQNQEDFRNLIMKHTNGVGVHFMMSDGGFSVEGQEIIQEILSKQLYLCQCLVALMIVRPGGHFVTKLFDLFTPFSAGLVYLMYRCFDSICIFKPNSSRPANSERYLICKKKKPDTEAVMQYLFKVNRMLQKRNDKNDVIHLVSPENLEADETFVNYLKNSNEILGEKQVIGLLKIAAFCEDTKLIELKQADMRKECLKYWKIPDKTRVIPPNIKPEDKIREILKDSSKIIGCDAQKLMKDNLKNTILNQPYDWYCIPCSSAQYIDEDRMATFYLSMGRRKVFRYIKGRWERITNVKLELPPDTLVYAELVYESRWTGKCYARPQALHIIDAYMLGGEDVSKKYICERHELIKKLCYALWKPYPCDYVHVRAKEIFMVGPDIDKNLRIVQTHIKSMSVAFECQKNSLEYDNEIDEKSVYFAFNSVLFLRSTASPWSRYISQKTKQTYVFNPCNGAKEYEIRRPPQAEASFIEAFEKRIIWHWPRDTSLNMKMIAQAINNVLQKA